MLFSSHFFFVRRSYGPVHGSVQPRHPSLYIRHVPGPVQNISEEVAIDATPGAPLEWLTPTGCESRPRPFGNLVISGIE